MILKLDKQQKIMYKKRSCQLKLLLIKKIVDRMVLFNYAFKNPNIFSTLSLASPYNISEFGL
jgi:hypothetical protein